MNKRLSIVDIANALNISKTSVSFILNGRAEEKRISDELVEKVMKFVGEVGYKPNSLAKSLRTGKSYTIGLMVEDISNPFYATIARLIEDRAYKNGYKIIYCSTDNDTAKTKDLIQMFRDRHVDGYIMAPPEGVEDEVADLLKSKLPVVMFDRYLPEIATDRVVINNKESIFNATNALLAQGYRSIAFVTFLSEQTQMKDRLQGYEQAIADAGAVPYIKQVRFEKDEELILGPIHEYLSRYHHELDAIVFGTNHVGTCGLKVIKNLGLSIPEDLALISFDDYDVFKLHTPPVTAIAQPVEDIADQVITLLLSKLHLKTPLNNFQQALLPTVMNVRKSSVRPSR